MIRVALILGLTGTAAAAQNTAREQVLIDAITAAGCIVTEDNEAAILDAAQMGEAEATTIVMALMTTGRAVPQDDDLRLMTGTCN